MNRPLIIMLLFCLACLGDGKVEIFRFDAPAKNDPIQDEMKLGTLSLQEHLYSKAIGHFNECLKLAADKEPVTSQATLLLAKAHLANKDADQALDTLQNHIKKHEAGQVPKKEMLEMRYLEALAYSKQGNWEKVLECSKQLTGEDDEKLRHDAILLCSDAMMKLGKWREIVTLISEYLEKCPEKLNDYDLQKRMVLANLSLQDYTSAEKSMKILNQIQGETYRLETQLLYVRLLALTGKVNEAVQEYRKIENYCPNQEDEPWYDMLTTLADTLCKSKNYKDALELYELGIKVTSGEKELDNRCQIININIDNGNTAEAEKELAELEKRFPESPRQIELFQAIARRTRSTNDFAAAAKYFRSITENKLADNEQRYLAFKNAGECLFNDGNLEEAINCFLEAEKLGQTQEQQAEARMNAGLVAEELYRQAKVSQKDNCKLLAQKAILHFRKVVEKYPNAPSTPQCLLEEAKLQGDTGDHQEARASYGEFAEKYPTHPQIELAKLNQGINMRKGANTKHGKMDAFDYLAGIGKELKDQQTAGAAYMEAYKCAREAGNFEKELSMLDELVAGKDKYAALAVEALYWRANLLFENGENEKALADVDTFLKEHKDNPLVDELCLISGDYYLNADNLDLALKYYTIALETNLNQQVRPDLLYAAGNVYFKQKQYDNAEAKLLELVTKCKDSKASLPVLPHAYYLLGQTYCEKKQFDQATDAFGECRKLATDSELGLAAQGKKAEMLLMRGKNSPQNDKDAQDKFKEAENCLREIREYINVHDLKKHPLCAMVEYRLAECLKWQKNYDGALELYQNIYINYLEKHGVHSALDDFYFFNAVFDMTELLEIRGDDESLNRALGFYERIAPLKSSFSKQAELRANQLKDKLKR